jgi:hypothetical protein
MTPRVVFSCVAENRPEFGIMTHNLVTSIRFFAGTLADAPIVVNFVDDVDPSIAGPLAALGAEVRIVERVSGGNPLANKLRMLELDEERDFDVLLALDCDVVVVGDPRPWLDDMAIAAKAADFDRFTDEEWRGVFGALDMPLPPRSLTATATGEAIYPYFNSGVISVPHALCRPLRDGWMRTFDRLSVLLHDRRDLIREPWHWLAEQASLGLAILDGGLQWRVLPTELNFPAHVRAAASVATGDPVIVHYHTNRDERGFLLRAASPALDPWLDAFNRRRAELTGQPYPGIARRPLHERLARTVRKRYWALVSDRPWYGVPSSTMLRDRAKRVIVRRRG